MKFFFLLSFSKKKNQIVKTHYFLNYFFTHQKKNQMWTVDIKERIKKRHERDALHQRQGSAHIFGLVHHAQRMMLAFCCRSSWGLFRCKNE